MPTCAPRLGISTVIVWPNAGHYGQMALYMRENNIVPPAQRAARSEYPYAGTASRPKPPELHEHIDENSSRLTF